MAKLKICPSLLEPEEVLVPSRTQSGRFYSVTTPTLLSDAVCDEGCPGYGYRGECWHIEAAKGQMHTWGTRDLSVTHCQVCGREAVEVDIPSL